MNIRREQISNAVARLSDLQKRFKSPMARFLTDRPDWVIEVEHLEQDGVRKLAQLLSAGGGGEVLTFALEGRTGHSGGRQYHLKGLRNGTYAKNTNIRSTSAVNVF